MDYPQCIDYLMSRLPMFQRSGAAAYKANLNNTTEICEILANPQNKSKAIHIAGTNGKGSLAHMLASVLQQAGYSTGLFTSPHLTDFRERIRINGKPIAQSAVIDFVHYGLAAFNALHPSFFEYTFGMAMDYFAREKVDVAVLETGMGGRLDSTNVCKPVVSLITNIGFDHMQFLGNSLRQIAAEKAGIIKPEIPIVISETQTECATVFKDIAVELHSDIYFADEIFEARWTGASSNSSFQREVAVIQQNKEIQNFHFPLPGNYQLKNIPGVMQVLEILRGLGYSISDQDISEGMEGVIKNTGFCGRWQVLSEKPLTICDTAHNEAGIREVMSQLGKVEKDELHMVFGMVNDKDIDKILSLLPGEASYYFCRPNIPRGLDEKKLQAAAQKHGFKGECYSSVEQAFQAAKLNAAPQDVIYVGGSAFVVAEVV